MKRMTGFSIAALTLLSGFQSQAFLKCKEGDKETVDLANVFYNRTVELYRNDSIERNKVIRANIFLNEAKMCSHTFSIKEFCDTTVPLIREFNGFRLNDSMEQITLMAEGKALCEK